MHGLHLEIETRAYIQSETAFGQAKMKGFLEMMIDLIRGCGYRLLSFYEMVDKMSLTPSIDQGLQDVPLKNIIGSAGRYQNFTRHFFPRSGDQSSKERWRTIYTLTVTGKGFPPIEVYKIDQVYFVKDGHHRLSVAADLGWSTIQAYVTELPGTLALKPGCNG